MKKNQWGFGVIEGILILIIICLIGFVGWYVWHAKNNTNKSLSATDLASNSATVKKKSEAHSASIAQTKACQIVPTKAPSDWKTFTSDQYKYDISYPLGWEAATSGGAENNSGHTPILTALLFTPPGNQGPIYGIHVTAQSLSEAVTDWENEVAQAQSNSAGTTFSILSKNICTFGGHNAERIDTKQSYGTTNVYDTEFYVAANGYSYKFKTNYQTSSDPLKDTSLLGVVESLQIK